MNNDIRSLIRIDKSNAKSAIEALVNAFRNYTLLQYYFLSEARREKISHYSISYVVFTGISYGEVYATSPNMEGVAVWILSSNCPRTFLRRLLSVSPVVVFCSSMYAGSKMRHVHEYFKTVHQRQAPFKHWILQTIGVAPRFQGKGYAGRLLSPMLSRIDKEGLPCYLATLDEQNVSLYEHFGFKIVDKSNVPETTLTNWAMLREAQ